MAQVLSLQRPRPGFEPQVCIISLLFFHCNSYAGITLKRIMLPQYPKSHASSCFKSRAGIQRTPYTQVNCSIRLDKSQTGHVLLGQNFTIKTSQLGPDPPPLVCNLLHLLFFLIIVLFVFTLLI